MTDSQMRNCISYVAINATRLPGGRLKVGNTIVENWPQSFEFDEGEFEWSEEEALSEPTAGMSHDILGYYFRQDTSD